MRAMDFKPDPLDELQIPKSTLNTSYFGKVKSLSAKSTKEPEILSDQINSSILTDESCPDIESDAEMVIHE